jgi:hypothetical protein
MKIVAIQNRVVGLTFSCFGFRSCQSPTTQDEKFSDGTTFVIIFGKFPTQAFKLEVTNN